MTTQETLRDQHRFGNGLPALMKTGRLNERRIWHVRKSQPAIIPVTVVAGGDYLMLGRRNA